MGAAKVDVASSMEDDSIQPDNLSKDTKMKTRDQDGRENSISISPGVSLVLQRRKLEALLVVFAVFGERVCELNGALYE
ncbi:hypothetical protein M9H77_26190 [Catharanthus roseus]|uniref:Uncharacterized protein n=1 Tax=Catharanthus roseus TaxID=4058 RepID=A0ACC0AAC7_CATRO|nr:hypothetical protein M9H77_26190 [Catharanthus roseus]